MSVCRAICDHHNSCISSRMGVTIETTFIWGGHDESRGKKTQLLVHSRIFFNKHYRMLRLLRYNSYIDVRVFVMVRKPIQMFTLPFRWVVVINRRNYLSFYLFVCFQFFGSLVGQQFFFSFSKSCVHSTLCTVYSVHRHFLPYLFWTLY